MSQKKEKDFSSAQEHPMEKTTKLKRRDDVDPPIYIGETKCAKDV